MKNYIKFNLTSIKTHTYGKFPIADNLGEIELNIAKIKSFKEWRIENESRIKVKMKDEVKEEKCGLAGLLWQQLGSVDQMYSNFFF